MLGAATSLKGLPWPLSQPDSCALLPFSAGQLTPMQAIEARHAVRSYTDEPLAPEVVEVLQRGHRPGERGSEPEHPARA